MTVYDDDGCLPLLCFKHVGCNKRLKKLCFAVAGAADNMAMLETGGRWYGKRHFTIKELFKRCAGDIEVYKF